MDQFATDRNFWALLVPELAVRDLDESLVFYRDTLGFVEKFSRPEHRFSYIEMGQAQFMLEEIPKDPEDMWLTAPLAVPFGRGINFQIEVQNVRSLYDRAREAGYEIFEPLETNWYREDDHENGQEQFLIQDPDGYLLRFMQHIGERPAQPID